MPVSISTASPAQGDIKILGSGTFTTVANNSTWEDAGNFSTAGALGDAEIFISMTGITSTGAGVGQKLGVGDTAGNSVVHESTTAAEPMYEYFTRQATKTATSEDYIQRTAAGTFTYDADSAGFNWNGAETVYIKAYCVATNILKLRWIAYLIKANIK